MRMHKFGWKVGKGWETEKNEDAHVCEEGGGGHRKDRQNEDAHVMVEGEEGVMGQTK